ncbi:hypothetical protein GUITHDRAFT_118944 [Guillardia theta CCMP2712]|uniref:Uncharacterized protein n=1 Tax=Guillardia theta (strain CCMP2712) TaxID=905079 RepID=L1IFQ7_GUITC|nr:hypothetical protein GUITHDRAFT_118944 [Guillardia theta CCMP2712]EKX34902.1 hypothetical protein GUITHDRAFT_118944 [Guillardia theta CCMP2712]|eukprot:XP_005821882.1 hypothetical protein GUITHDRAFT_118944 [Guillardia theta CCMP2712]
MITVPQAGSHPDLDRCGVNTPPPYEVRWGSSDPWMYQPRVVETYFFPVSFFILFFICITIFADVLLPCQFLHPVLHLYHDLYRAIMLGAFIDALQKGLPRYDRWIEYALSSSSMIIVICLYTGTTDVWVLTFVSLAQSVMCFLGYVVEAADYVASKECHLKDTESIPDEKIEPGEYNNNTEESEMAFRGVWGSDRTSAVIVPVRLNMPWQKGPVVRPAYRTIGSEMSALRGAQGVDPKDLKKIMDYVKGLAFLFGMYLFVMIWFYIGNSLFGDYMGKFNCLNNKNLFSYTVFPLLIYIFELVLFFTFAAAQIYFHFIQDEENKASGYRREYAYNMLSTFSKAFLAIILIAQSAVFSV